MDKDFNIWEGVYNSFDEVPIVGDGFKSDTWINHSLEKIKELIKLRDENKSKIFNDLPLYSIVANLYLKNKKIKILDFGGGMGNSFIPLCSTLPDSKQIEFTVVEDERNVLAARNIFSNDARIKFVSNLPDGNFDIIHISSSLQYIDNWESLLVSLSKYKAKYFIFTDLPAGNIKNTFVSAQNYYESRIPHIFFKLDDILNVMSGNNYKLIYQNNFQANILKENNHYPQDNFKEEYRINHSKTLVFKR